MNKEDKEPRLVRIKRFLDNDICFRRGLDDPRKVLKVFQVLTLEEILGLKNIFDRRIQGRRKTVDRLTKLSKMEICTKVLSKELLEREVYGGVADIFISLMTTEKFQLGYYKKFGYRILLKACRKYHSKVLIRPNSPVKISF